MKLSSKKKLNYLNYETKEPKIWKKRERKKVMCRGEEKVVARSLKWYTYDPYIVLGHGEQIQVGLELLKLFTE